MSPRVKGGGEQPHGADAPPTDRTSQTQVQGLCPRPAPLWGLGRKEGRGQSGSRSEDLHPHPGSLHLGVTPGEYLHLSGHHLGVMRKRARP